MKPFNVGTSEWLEEPAPCTSNVARHVSGVQLLANQACRGVEMRSPCQDCDLGSADCMLPGFDPRLASLHQPSLTLVQEGLESFQVGSHGPRRIPKGGVPPIG